MSVGHREVSCRSDDEHIVTPLSRVFFVAVCLMAILPSFSRTAWGAAYWERGGQKASGFDKCS